MDTHDKQAVLSPYQKAQKPGKERKKPSRMGY